MHRSAVALALLSAAASPAIADVETVRANVSVSQAVENLTAAVEAAGATVFAVIDHQKGAQSMGAELRPTVKVIFGAPKIGTPAIAASQTMGLMLPLEMLIWEDADGAVYISTPEIDHEAEKHGLDHDHPAVKPIAGALAKMRDAAAGS
jgi:uncharacterized protein (DUF302 family)